MTELQRPISSLRERMSRAAGPEASEVGLAAVASAFPKFGAPISEHEDRTAEKMKAETEETHAKAIAMRAKRGETRRRWWRERSNVGAATRPIGPWPTPTRPM